MYSRGMTASNDPRPSIGALRHRRVAGPKSAVSGDEGFVRIKANIALGSLTDGNKDILGIWIEQTEIAKF